MERAAKGNPGLRSRRLGVSSLAILFAAMASAPPAHAQQFAGDNQWVAPHGVGTFAATAGEEYAQLYAIAALIPEWEFNLQINWYYDDPRDETGSYTAVNVYAKRRLWENDAETQGYSVVFGTGAYPEHLEHGTVASAFQSWWAMVTATYGFLDDAMLLDILPGASVNLDESQTGETAWAFTYSSRLAVYGVVPQSALVGEVFGSAGEASAKPAYRVGVRWESPRWIVAGTYSAAFDGSPFAGFEVGVIAFTDPIFCFGGC